MKFLPKVSFFTALLTLALLVPRSSAQTSAAQTTPAQKSESPTIVTNADEVTLDLVVRDKQNKPVLDLKPEDIAVTDSKSSVKLSDLRLVTGTSGRAPLITLVFDRLEQI